MTEIYIQLPWSSYGEPCIHSDPKEGATCIKKMAKKFPEKKEMEKILVKQENHP